MFPIALLLLLAAGCVKCEQLTQPASVTVQSSQRLTITCQVSYSVSSWHTAWIRQPAGKGLEFIQSARVGSTTYYKDSLKNKFSVDLQSSSNTVTLNGQNVQPEDTAVYYCARHGFTGYFDYWGKGTTVTVTTATSSRPTVFPLIPCGSESGEMVTLGCLATGFNPSSVTFSWTKGGTALTDFIQYPAVQKGDVYTGVSQVQVRRQEWGSGQNIQCVATHAAGNAQANIDNPQPPPTPTRPPTAKPTTIRVPPTKKATPPQPPKTTPEKHKPTMGLHILPELQTDEINLTDEVTVVCLVTSSEKKDFLIEWVDENKNMLESPAKVFNFTPQLTENGKKWRFISLCSMTKEYWRRKPEKIFICRVQSEKLEKKVSAAVENSSECKDYSS